MKKGDKKIEVYLDAKAEAEAINRAIAESPANDEPRLRVAFHQAAVRMRLAYAKLTGGELARARRLLAERTTNAVSDIG